MPASRLSFRAGPSWVSLDDAGAVVSVVPDARPGESYLDGGGQVRVRSGGEVLDWSAPLLGIDADEVEVGYRHPVLTATVRHAFGARWGIRLALANVSSDRLILDEVGFGWESSYGWPAWALAAGAVGSYAIASPDGRGPLLGGVLGLGALESATPAELGLGRVVLEPGGRYVVSWSWAWFTNARSFAERPGGRRGDRQVPRSLHLSVGEAALISADEDEALILPPRLVAEPVRDQLELVAQGSGRQPVELRSAGGVTHYDLCWAEPVDALLAAAGADLLTGRRTPAGIVRLDGIDAAVVLQLSLRIGLDDIDSAEEALDLFTARLGEPGGADPRTAGFLCAEFDRTGEQDVLDAAARIVLATSTVVPGLGLSAAQVGLALVLSGLPLDPVTAHLESLVQTLPPPGAGSFVRQAAALELAIVAPSAAPRDDVTDRLLALGSWFGGGLKGAALRPRPVAEAAHLTAVLAALDERTSVSMRRHWPATAHELGRWTEAAVITQLTEGPAGPTSVGAAHAWLAVAARTR